MRLDAIDLGSSNALHRLEQCTQLRLGHLAVHGLVRHTDDVFIFIIERWDLKGCVVKIVVPSTVIRLMTLNISFAAIRRRAQEYSHGSTAKHPFDGRMSTEPEMRCRCSIQRPSARAFILYEKSQENVSQT